MKRHYDSLEALQLERQSMRLSDPKAITVRQIQNSTSSFRSALLDRHLEENEVRLIVKLLEPNSAADWNVIDYLVKYVSTPSDERINIPVPAAYVMKSASQYGLQVSKTWFLDRLKALGKFLTSLFDLFLMICFSKFFSTIWPGHSNNGAARDNPPSAEPATANSSTANPATAISHSTDNKNRRSANSDDLSAQIAAKGLKMPLEKCVNIG
ncbi:PREDICTED: LOC110771749 [Prunus dulcis]|uniref:PREDICTED: LOC110771749 n=1 Tax=Prunus dulcis TaxID=3755 RepID=A0A5E4E5R5_PRUDU|nr:PREDICTED: LOC110771749 [Prunus dulcis]